MSDQDEHAIWNSRWRGHQVDTPDGFGLCCGFNNGRTGIEYQVITVNSEGVKVWRDYPRAQVKLVKR